MQIKCKHCNEVVDAEDINLDRMLGKCKSCNAVFSFEDQIDASGVKQGPRSRGVVPLPKGFVVEDDGRDLRISRRWFTPVAIFLLFFCVAWDGFLVFWYAMALGEKMPGPFGIFFILFPICHVAVGVGLTYFMLALFLNSTTIVVSQGLLSVRHGPLPWKGVRDIPIKELDQVYCKEKQHRSRNGSHTTFEVHAIQRGPKPEGGSLKLLSGLLEAEQALYIEQAIEKHLGIEDRFVGGEMPR